MEKWVAIKGYELVYEVSNMGNVRQKNTPLILIKGHFDKDGYRRVKLRIGGTRKEFGVHRLVANAFIDNPLKKPYVNHKDSDKSNNDISNLEWCTCRENIIHAFNNNRVFRRGKSVQLRAAIKRKRIKSKVTEAMRKHIKELSDQGLLLREIKAFYNLSLPYISMIIHGTA